MIAQLIWTTWTLLSAVWERLLNSITHSLTYSITERFTGKHPVTCDAIYDKLFKLFMSGTCFNCQWYVCWQLYKADGSCDMYDYHNKCEQWIMYDSACLCYTDSISGGCFTNVTQALQDILLKFVYSRNCTSYENFKLKLCMYAQNQLEILSINVVSGTVYFQEIILERLQNIIETTTWCSKHGSV